MLTSINSIYNNFIHNFMCRSGKKGLCALLRKLEWKARLLLPVIWYIHIQASSFYTLVITDDVNVGEFNNVGDIINRRRGGLKGKVT